MLLFVELDERRTAAARKQMTHVTQPQAAGWCLQEGVVRLIRTRGGTAGAASLHEHGMAAADEAATVDVVARRRARRSLCTSAARNVRDAAVGECEARWRSRVSLSICSSICSLSTVLTAPRHSAVLDTLDALLVSNLVYKVGYSTLTFQSKPEPPGPQAHDTATPSDKSPPPKSP